MQSLAARFYCDPEVAELERRAIFRRSWQLVGSADAVAGSGDHIVGELGGTPVIVVRGVDGELRAFHNVCRHRAGPLALADGRGAKALHCKYHGWTYTLTGQLRSAPEMQDADGFDVSKICLPPAHVAQWSSLVFGAIDAAPAFDEVVDGIATQAQATFGQPLRFDRRVSYELACNWKVYVDNYLEGYHLPHIHPALNQLLDYRSYTTTCARWSSVQHSPLESAESAPYGNGDAYYYFVWPNTMLNCLPGRLQTNRVVPITVDRCRVEFDYYYAGAQGATYDDAKRDEDQQFSDHVQIEDAAICEAVQKGLASGSYEAGRLNPKRETGVMHFHELLREAYSVGLKADPRSS